MECPKCKNDLRIVNHKFIVKEGKVYVEQTLKCVNKNCTEDEIIIEKETSES